MIWPLITLSRTVDFQRIFLKDWNGHPYQVNAIHLHWIPSMCFEEMSEAPCIVGMVHNRYNPFFKHLSYIFNLKLFTVVDKSYNSLESMDSGKAIQTANQKCLNLMQN